MIKRTVELGFFLALALILAYVESLIPFSFGIPGIKLGLPNLIVVLLLAGNSKAEQNGALRDKGRSWDGVKEALLVNGLRIILSGFLFSNLYTILYALAGAVCSFAAMLLGRRLKCFSVIGVSVLGGVFHNIGQIVVAMLVVKTVYVGYYIPYLIVAGTVTGAVLGFIAMELLPYLYRLNNRVY
ncbi:MAG: Gx transporter family protein [Lachnospiraceae bacterium]|nr:Gx transporter family protein [Lachnospiraceae bacterium]